MSSYEVQQRAQAAIRDVKLGMAVREAARKWDMRRTYLRRRLDGIPTKKEAYEDQQALSPLLESQLAQWVIGQSRLGFAPALVKFRFMAQQLLNASGASHTVGQRWHARFLARNEEIKTIRSKIIHYSRVNGATVSNIHLFFDRLDAPELANIPPERFYNTDEMGIGQGVGSDHWARIDVLTPNVIRNAWRTSGIWPRDREKPLSSKYVILEDVGVARGRLDAPAVLIRDSTPDLLTEVAATPIKTPSGGQELRRSIRKLATNDPTFNLPSQRLFTRKASKALDQQASKIADLEARIDYLTTKLEKTAKKVRQKVTLTPGQRFIRMANIRQAKRRLRGRVVYEDEASDQDVPEKEITDTEDCIQLATIMLTLLRDQALPVLEARIRESGGVEALEPSVERPRFELLRKAPRETHKLYVPGAHDPSLIDSAFGQLSTILRSNSVICSAQLNWLVQFPGALDVLRHSFPEYSRVVRAVLDFLVCLGQFWMALIDEHKKLGYPLLFDEMLSTFQLHSTVLQPIAFKASRRTCGIADGPVGTQMDELFKEDQAQHLQADGYFHSRTNRESHKEPMSQLIIQKYKALAAGTQVPNNDGEYISPPTFAPDLRPHVFQQQQQLNNLWPSHARPPTYHESFNRAAAAGIRSPKRMLNGTLKPLSQERYYQYVKYLALSPSAVPPHPDLYTFHFGLSDQEYAKLSRNTVMYGNARPSLPINIFSNGSVRVRLRCVFCRHDVESIPEGQWVKWDTVWPDHTYIQLNGHILRIGHEQHYRHDQPVEVDHYVVPGRNELKVLVPPNTLIPSTKKPFIAIEVVETLSHSSVLALNNFSVLHKTPAEQTLNIIKTRLGDAPCGALDGDITMLSSDLVIRITDPFSSRIFDVPVRGISCEHLDCFDLETWLNTRPIKNWCVCGTKGANCGACPKESSLTDKWKCPICGEDARPQVLRIDGFLSEVRAILAVQRQLTAKDITVSAHGSWKPIIDSDMEEGGEGSGVDVRPVQVQRPARPQSVTKIVSCRAPIEIITLDDD
ncbi:hypothetical protein PG987_001845 [Apiospora arundinis]